MKALGVAVTVVVFIGLVACTGAADHTASNRDAKAYYRYVMTYAVDGWRTSTDPHGPARDRAWAATHRAAVMAEGDRACEWLARQPSAGRVDPSGQSDVSIMATRYVRQASPLQFEDHRRAYMTSGAWAYLCRSVRDEKTAPRSLRDD